MPLVGNTLDALHKSHPASRKAVLHVVSCGNKVSTGMIVLFRKESFPVCSGWGEVMC